MLKWSEGHLNFTAVFFTVFSWVFGILLVIFALDIAGMKYLPYPGQSYEIFSPGAIVDFLPTFTFQAMVDVAILISLPVYYWVLKKKKRSIWYLLLFLPPLVPSGYAGFVLVFQMPFWLIGLILLLALKNKSGTQPAVKS